MPSRHHTAELPKQRYLTTAEIGPLDLANAGDLSLLREAWHALKTGADEQGSRCAGCDRHWRKIKGGPVAKLVMASAAGGWLAFGLLCSCCARSKEIAGVVARLYHAMFGEQPEVEFAAPGSIARN